eukprot:scpid103314/ scgid8842/ 
MLESQHLYKPLERRVLKVNTPWGPGEQLELRLKLPVRGGVGAVRVDLSRRRRRLASLALRAGAARCCTPAAPTALVRHCWHIGNKPNTYTSIQFCTTVSTPT